MLLWQSPPRAPVTPPYQRNVALGLVKKYGFHHESIDSGEMSDANYTANPTNRCYFCKHDLYSRLQAMATQRAFDLSSMATISTTPATTAPGRKAGSELEIRSPLIEARMSKADIRELSRQHGLPTWDQPASACLSSRIPYGSEVTVAKLRMIDQGEEVLRASGFRQSRVRHHGNVARIEIAREEMVKAFDLDLFDKLSREFKKIGFQYVALDVDGYRTGALNEILTQIKVSSR
jgi:TIGR00268 family protein